MEIKIVKSVKDDFCEQSGPSTVTHAFLSLDSMLFELGRFYEGPHMNVDTGKRLEKIHEFSEAIQESAPVEKNKSFDIQAGEDGLWLHCPQIDGKQHSINLLQPDKYRLSQMLNALWQTIRS